MALSPAGLALWLAASGIVGAAPATPTTTAPPDCDVTPRSREEITALLEDSDIATPAATTAGETLPTGTPVDRETAETMAHLVATWLACQNVGEPLRAWALFSDGYLFRLLARQGLPLDADTAASPNRGTTGGAAMLDFRDARALPDGRYGAMVTLAYPSVPMPKTFFFFFTEVEDRLLIDGILGEISFSVP